MGDEGRGGEIKSELEWLEEAKVPMVGCQEEVWKESEREKKLTGSRGRESRKRTRKIGKTGKIRGRYEEDTGKILGRWGRWGRLEGGRTGRIPMRG